MTINEVTTQVPEIFPCFFSDNCLFDCFLFYLPQDSLGWISNTAKTRKIEELEGALRAWETMKVSPEEMFLVCESFGKLTCIPSLRDLLRASQLTILPHVKNIPFEYSSHHLLSELMRPWLVFWRAGFEAECGSNWNHHFVKGHTTYVLICCLAIGHFVVHMPQVAMTFHRVMRPSEILSRFDELRWIVCMDSPRLLEVGIKPLQRRNCVRRICATRRVTLNPKRKPSCTRVSVTRSWISFPSQNFVVRRD